MRLVDLEDNFPKRLTRFEYAVSLARFPERQNAVDDGPKPACLDVLQDREQ